MVGAIFGEGTWVETLGGGNIRRSNIGISNLENKIRRGT